MAMINYKRTQHTKVLVTSQSSMQVSATCTNADSLQQHQKHYWSHLAQYQYRDYHSFITQQIGLGNCQFSTRKRSPNKHGF